MGLFEDYGKRLQRDDAATRQRRIKLTRNTMSRRFESDPSFFEAAALEPDGVTSSTKKLKIINADYATHLNPARINSRYFVAHPETPIVPGTMLFDLYDSSWMVVSAANLTDVTDTGMIQRTNYIAKWMYQGQILENYAVVTGVSRRSDGVEEDFYLTAPNDSLMLHFPKNEVTGLLARDVRLMVTGMPFKITRIDGYTDPGFYYIIAKEDQLNSKDNVELGICDYTPLPEPSEDLVLIGDKFITFGQNYRYFAQNLDEEEVITSWNIESGLEYIESHEEENDLIISVINNRRFIGKNVTISFTASNGNTRSKTLTIVSLL